jgi:hypothetical protein
MALLQHIRDDKELQVITHYKYKSVGQLTFVTEAEKKAFLDECGNSSQFSCISAQAFNALDVDLCRPFLSQLCIVDLYRAITTPHPKLGPTIFVY